MIFVLDVHLPSALGVWLNSLGHQAHSSGESLGPSASDKAIASFARGAIVITKDKDFATLAHAGACRAVVLRCGNVRTYDLLAWLAPRWPDIALRLGQGARLIEVD